MSLTGPAAGATLTGPVTLHRERLLPGRHRHRSTSWSTAWWWPPATSAPYTATWDSTTVGDGPVTITARATDTGGNQTTTAGQAATVSNAASRGGNLLANASLETNTGGGSVPDCWQQTSSATNTATWAYTTSAHTGSHAENVTITAYTSGDRKFLTAQGTSACSPRVTPGSTYTLGAWYQSTQPTRIAVYYQNASGTWIYWTQSPAFAASSSWAQAAWTTPAVPAGATALSFGTNLAAAGSLTTDDYTMTAGAAPPAVSVTGPAPGATLTGPVTFTANASSQVGIAKVAFLVDGVAVATATAAPYTATWDSTTVGDGPVTITAQATDTGGTKTTTTGQAATVSNAASRGGNLLANASLETNTGGGTVPDCWQQTSSATNTATWAYTTSAHTGSHAENLTITAYTSGDRKFLTAQGTSACSPGSPRAAPTPSAPGTSPPSRPASPSTTRTPAAPGPTGPRAPRSPRPAPGPTRPGPPRPSRPAPPPCPSAPTSPPPAASPPTTTP